MPGGVEFGGKRDHEGPGGSVHQGRCGDAGTEARVVARTAWPVNMAVSLSLLMEEWVFVVRGPGKLRLLSAAIVR